MLTNGQKRALHAAARAVRLNEDQYRWLIANVGGFRSAADRSASRQGYIAVMAAMEDLGAANGVRLGRDPAYWRDQLRQARPNDALLHRIRSEAEALGWDEQTVNRFLAGPHMSGGQAVKLETAPAYWLRRLLQAMVTLREREASPCA